MTRRNRFRTAITALVGFSAAAVVATADEEKVAFDKLPAAVKKAVKKHFPEAKVRGAAKEVEDGKTTYEVELTVEGHSVNVAMSHEGKILEVEKEVPVAKLPAAVKKKLAKKYPGARIEKAEQITKGQDGPVHYEVAIKAEVVLTGKGKIVSAKEEEDDDKTGAKVKDKEKEEEDDDEDEDDDKPGAKAGNKEHAQSAAKASKKEKEEDEDDDDDKPSKSKKEKKEHEEEDDD